MQVNIIFEMTMVHMLLLALAAGLVLGVPTGAKETAARPSPTLPIRPSRVDRSRLCCINCRWWCRCCVS